MEPFAAIERSHGWNAGDLPLVQVQVLIYRLSGEERSALPGAESAVERELVLRLAACYGGFAARPASRLLFSNWWLRIPASTNARPHARTSVGPQLRAVLQSDATEGSALSSNAKKDIADCFLRLADLPTSALDRLSRYEHLLWRQARQIVFTLESLRRRKRQLIRSTFPFSFRRREPGALSEEFR